MNRSPRNRQTAVSFVAFVAAVPVMGQLREALIENGKRRCAPGCAEAHPGG
jgi:hypothetical protein